MRRSQKFNKSSRSFHVYILANISTPSRVTLETSATNTPLLKQEFSTNKFALAPDTFADTPNLKDPLLSEKKTCIKFRLNHGSATLTMIFPFARPVFNLSNALTGPLSSMPYTSSIRALTLPCAIHSPISLKCS